MRIPKVDLHEVALRNHINLGDVKRIIAQAKRSMKPIQKNVSVTEDGEERVYTVIRQGVGSIRTEFGLFWQFDFLVNDCWKKYSVVVRANLAGDFMPDFQGSSKILMRIDSGCESGQRFNDVTCDCRGQLVASLQEIAKVGEGIVIHIPHQDGRGMGNHFKLATLSLQEKLQLTTVESASVLTGAGSIDRRTYAGAVAILRFFRVAEKREIGLLTNNPFKLTVFADNGYRSIDRMPMVVPPTHHTRQHLESKQVYLGHTGLVMERMG